MAMFFKTYRDEISHKEHELSVLEYNSTMSYYVCRCKETTAVIAIDLLIDGDFSDVTNPNDLVGKTVVLDYAYPYAFIGSGVRIKD